MAYPRLVLIVLTALTLAAFISVGCQSEPSPTPAAAPTTIAAIPTTMPQQTAEPSQTPKPTGHGSSATLSYSNPYVCPYTDSHSGADARRYA